MYTAFINGTLEERYSCSSQLKGEEHLVCKLNCSLYGLKQAPCCWNPILDGYLNLCNQQVIIAFSYVGSGGEMIVGVCMGTILKRMRGKWRISNLLRLRDLM